MKSSKLLFWAGLSLVGLSLHHFLASGISRPVIASPIGQSIGEMTESQISSDGFHTSWIRHYSSRTPGNDRPTALAMDSEGNAYVTGSSENMPFGTDIQTFKYDLQGRVLWSASYDSPFHGDDTPVSLVVDQEGNVYVAGSSWGDDSRWDFLTIKYDAAGIEQWVARFHSSGTADDRISALALDDKGNTYVTGISGSASRGKFVTIKYNQNGRQQWIASLDCREDEPDSPSALLLDEAGNIYVTGTCGVGKNSDLVAAKYNNEGSQLWIRSYDGPGHNADRAPAATLDGAGNLFVTGTSARSSTGDDFVTIKYDPNGTEQWIVRYNGPKNLNDYARAIAVDIAGNVLVAGTSFDSAGVSVFATLKYDSSGRELWVKRSPESQTSSYDVQALALHENGDVYVTGVREKSSLHATAITIKYDSAGVEQWTLRHDSSGHSINLPAALKLDNHDGVYLTGTKWQNAWNHDFATSKFSNSGAMQWFSDFGGEGWGDGYPSKLMIDSKENLCILATVGGIRGVLKYDAHGGEQNFFPCEAQANLVTVDATDHVLIAGQTSAAAGRHGFVAKYDANGVLRWRVLHNLNANTNDLPVALVTDHVGSVYMTMFSNQNYLTVKYLSDGSLAWQANYNGPANGIDKPAGIAVDSAGSVYVTGSSAGLDSGRDYLTIKYDRHGARKWSKRLDVKNNDDDARALAVDMAGNVYVTGSAAQDFVTIKYDSNGVKKWIASLEGAWHGGWDRADGILVDAAGNVYVNGQSEPYYRVVKYDSIGKTQWVAGFEGIARYQHYMASSFAVDDSGNVYLSGRVGYIYNERNESCNASSLHFRTAKFHFADGRQLWSEIYDGPGHTNDYVVDLKIAESGALYVTGYSEGQACLCLSEDCWTAITTIKYKPAVAAAVVAEKHRQSSVFSLAQNYPNPFNPSTSIAYQLPQPAQVKLTVFNTLGQVVIRLVNRRQEAGFHTVMWHGRNFAGEAVPSGIYYYRLEVEGGFVETKKMVLAK